MSFPSLTPASQTSAIILPASGTYDSVVDSLAIGFYSGSSAFLSGATIIASGLVGLGRVWFI